MFSLEFHAQLNKKHDHTTKRFKSTTNSNRKGEIKLKKYILRIDSNKGRVSGNLNGNNRTPIKEKKTQKRI